jgi:hypothetical protein
MIIIIMIIFIKRYYLSNNLFFAKANFYKKKISIENYTAFNFFKKLNYIIFDVLKSFQTCEASFWKHLWFVSHGLELQLPTIACMRKNKSKYLQPY